MMAMMDQATNLRLIARDHAPLALDSAKEATAARIVVCTGGKGGVGKSVIAANLAGAIAKQGKRALLIDANVQGTHLHVMMGATPVWTIQDFVDGACELEEAIYREWEPLHLLAGTASFPRAGQGETAIRRRLMDGLYLLATEYDAIVIDSGVASPANLAEYSARADLTLIVTTPELTALTDTYALIKYLFAQPGRRQINVLVNMASTEGQAREIVARLNIMTERFLRCQVWCGGAIPYDPAVPTSVETQRLFVTELPSSAASRGVAGLADKVMGSESGLFPPRQESSRGEVAEFRDVA